MPQYGREEPVGGTRTSGVGCPHNRLRRFTRILRSRTRTVRHNTTSVIVRCAYVLPISGAFRNYRKFRSNLLHWCRCCSD